MYRSRYMSWARITRLLALAACCALLLAEPGIAPRRLFIRVGLGSGFDKPLSGRLLIFLQRGHGAAEVDLDEFHPKTVSVAAKEVQDLAPGAAVDVDTDDIAYPEPFSRLTAGDYQAQAVLDVNHTYNYVGRAPGDPLSEVAKFSNFPNANGAEPVITLTKTAPPRPSGRSPFRSWPENGRNWRLI